MTCVESFADTAGCTASLCEIDGSLVFTNPSETQILLNDMCGMRPQGWETCDGNHATPACCCACPGPHDNPAGTGEPDLCAGDTGTGG